MSSNSGADILHLTNTMGYLAHCNSLNPEDRLNRLDIVTNFAEHYLGRIGTPINETEYVRALRMRTWLACIPSLRATAANLPHSANISQEVLENLMPTLSEAVLDNTKSVRDFKGGGKIHGQIAEMAVLGVILWSHANIPDRAKRKVLPATSRQDASKKRGRASGFDLLLDTQCTLVPLQIKSSARDYMARTQGYKGRPYKKEIAVIYVSRLVGKSRNSCYSPQILGDAVIREDKNVLFRAIKKIDNAVKNRPQTKDAELLYAA